jgi:hypothetical protein
MFYSPYGRAYETSHAYDFSPASGGRFVDSANIGQLTGIGNIIATDPDGQSIPWNSFSTTGAQSPPPCECGESCACHTCFEHRGPAQALLNMSLGGACANPDTCTSCFGGNIMTGPALQANAAEIPIIDEWIRQLATPLPSPYGSQSFPYTTQQQMQVMASASSLPQYSRSAIDSNFLGQWTPTQFSGATECCSGSCKCPPGLCTCTSECCGCCQGCTCESHRRREGSQITFAVSGERSQCCAGGAIDASKQCGGTLFPSLPSSPDESSYRSRASSMSLDGGFQEWNRDPRYDVPVKQCCSKERTTSSATPYYVSTNEP